jgi:peptide/nickel transport system substrate-binding protein
MDLRSVVPGVVVCALAVPSVISLPAEPPAIDRPLILSQRSDALTLDPYDENETPTFSVQSNIFDSLIETDADLEIVPSLAESWTQIDELTWDFHLRQGVTFHNGNPLTADDVVFSLDRAKNWVGSETQADIVTVSGVEAVDTHTVRITTEAPDPILLNRLFNVLIMDRETTEELVASHGDGHLVENPNGTGPYRLQEWSKDDHLTLVAFDDHWRGPPVIREVVFRPISNDASRLAALLAGGVHLITDVPVRDTERIEANPELDLLRRPSLRLIYLGLDCGRDQADGVPSSPPNPLRDRRVREAIYLAIDEQGIVDRVMNGFAVPAAQLVPPTVFGHDPSIERPPHDPERARELLAEAGYPDGFEVRLDAPNDRYVNDARIAQAIAGQLARVDIRVEVDARPKTIFFEDENQGRCSFFLIGWANSNGDASGTFEFLLHTPDPVRQVGGANDSTAYSNPELDRLIDEAARTVDRDAREELLHRAMRVAVEDLPHIPLHYQVDLYGMSRDLEWYPRQDRRLRAFEMKWASAPP